VPEPHVAVVILNYNGLEDTLGCVRALRSGTYKALSIIVIDNASKNSEGKMLATELSDARVIVNMENSGFGAGCNQGAAVAVASEARFILFLNNDTIPDASMVREMVGVMRSNSNIALCGARVLNASPPHAVQCVGYRYSNWIGIPRIIGKDAPAGAKLEVGRLSWIMGCALMVSTSFWRESGGFDPEFFLYWEDVLLCWQARQSGHLLKIAESAVVLHRKKVGSEFSRRHIYHMFYGQMRFSIKTAAWYQWPTLSFGLLIVAIGYAYFAYRHRGINVLPLLLTATRDAIRGSPQRHVEI